MENQIFKKLTMLSFNTIGCRKSTLAKIGSVDFLHSDVNILHFSGRYNKLSLC